MNLFKPLRAAGIKLLIGARPQDLLHELRRQTHDGSCSEEAHCHKKRKRAMPHRSDKVGFTMHEKRKNLKDTAVKSSELFG